MASNSYNISAKVVTPEPSLPDVVLTLDGKSARVLRKIIGSITGFGEGRKVVDRVYNALTDAGVARDDSISFSGTVTGGQERV